jgi:hypothetical protein
MITGAWTLIAGLACIVSGSLIGTRYRQRRAIAAWLVILAWSAMAFTLLVIASLWSIGESYRLLLVVDHYRTSFGTIQAGTALISIAPIVALAGAIAVTRGRSRPPLRTGEPTIAV